jgi:hypothetical protein
LDPRPHAWLDRVCRDWLPWPRPARASKPAWATRAMGSAPRISAVLAAVHSPGGCARTLDSAPGFSAAGAVVALLLGQPAWPEPRECPSRFPKPASPLSHSGRSRAARLGAGARPTERARTP